MSTREQWLVEAAEEVGAHVKHKTGAEVPTVRVSCGWPSRTVRKTVGECWVPSAASDGVSQVFISPLLDNPADVLAVLVHELCHAIIQKRDHEAAAIDPGHKQTPGHGAAFKALATTCGLEGKMTTTTPSDGLVEELKVIAARLGDYPHAALSLGDLAPKQTTRMRKLMSPCCDYTVRTTQKWLDEGLPMCPHGTEMQPA